MRCTKLTRGGKACQAYAVHGGNTCLLHSDDTIAKRLAIQRRKPQSVVQLPIVPVFEPPKNLAELQALIATAITATMAGRLVPKVGNAVGMLGTVLMNILRTTELRDRVEALERWREQEQRRKVKVWRTT